jgi:3-hydroxyacyl-CoA dehydrogenase
MMKDKVFMLIKIQEIQQNSWAGCFHYFDNIRKNKTLWSNSGSAIEDLGDGIINFEIRSKMNFGR